MRTGDGQRRRRMIRGTIARIGDYLAMQYGPCVPTRDLDRTSSLRSTVMCALLGSDRSDHRISAGLVVEAPSNVRRLRAPAPQMPERWHGVQGFAPSGRASGGADEAAEL